MAKTDRISYAFCRICGRQPKSKLDEPNYGPVRYWEPDDGWIFGTLCRWCLNDYGDRQPRPDDFAYREHHEDIATDIRTDEDPMLIFEDLE